ELTTLSSKRTTGSDWLATLKPCPEKKVGRAVGPDIRFPDLSVISSAVLTACTVLKGPAASAPSGGRHPQEEVPPLMPLTLTPTVTLGRLRSSRNSRSRSRLSFIFKQGGFFRDRFLKVFHDCNFEKNIRWPPS